MDPGAPAEAQPMPAPDPASVVEPVPFSASAADPAAPDTALPPPPAPPQFVEIPKRPGQLSPGWRLAFGIGWAADHHRLCRGVGIVACDRPVDVVARCGCRTAHDPDPAAAVLRTHPRNHRGNLELAIPALPRDRRGLCRRGDRYRRPRTASSGSQWSNWCLPAPGCASASPRWPACIASRYPHAPPPHPAFDPWRPHPGPQRSNVVMTGLHRRPTR